MRVLRWLRGLLTRVFGPAPGSVRPTTPFPLERLLEDQITHHSDPWRNIADLIVQKFAAQGVRLSNRERRRIEESLRREEGDVHSIDVRSWKWWDKRSINIDLTEDDAASLLDRLDESFDPASAAHQMIEDAPERLGEIRKAYRFWLRGQNRRVSRLEARIAAKWGEPLESLGLLIELADNIGESVGRHYEEEPPADARLVYVLTRLHGRGIHVAREIHTLLRTGFPDAAMARWRSLHDVVVVSSFILEHGGECAERYVDHNAVASFRAAEQYQRSADRLGFVPFTDEELAELRAARDAAVTKYGKPFGRDYGWAASILNNPRPTFVDLETAVGLSHMRPYYGMASENVHAGPRGLRGKLGSVNEDLLLLGPSPYGLADPGQNTALSLVALIANRMRLCTVLDTVVTTRVAVQLAQEAVTQFVARDPAEDGSP